MSYQSAVLSDNPCIFWRLQETSGSTADNATGVASGDGTIAGDVGDASYNGTAVYQYLNVLGGVDFNGYVGVGNIDSGVVFTGFPSNRLSIEFVLYDNETIYNPGSPTRQGLVSYAATGAAREFAVHRDLVDNAFELYIHNDAYLFSTTGVTPTTGLTPKHVVITWTAVSGVAKLYVNGVLCETGTGLRAGATLVSISDGYLLLGQDQTTVGSGGTIGAIDPENCYTGGMFNFSLFNQTLTAEQVTAHYVAFAEEQARTYADWGAGLVTSEDLVAPVVEFTTSSPIDADDAVVFTVTESVDFAQLDVKVWADYANRSEVIWDGYEFYAPYAGSARVSSYPTETYTIERTADWQEAFTLRVQARDANNVTDAEQAYTLNVPVSLTIDDWTASPVAASADVGVTVTSSTSDGFTNTISVLMGGVSELVYLYGVFQATYEGSGVVSTDGGKHLVFTIRKAGGWTGPFTVTVDSVSDDTSESDSQSYTLTSGSGEYPPLMNPFTLE